MMSAEIQQDDFVADLVRSTRRGLAQLDVEVRAMAAGATADKTGVADEIEAAVGMQPRTFTNFEVDGMLAAYASHLREHAPEVHRLLWGITAALILLHGIHDEGSPATNGADEDAT